MEVTNYFNKKIKRKNFFASIGTGVLSFVVLRTFPFNLFSKNQVKKTRKIKVQINPLAVQRKNSGVNNV
jgi:hypothetical protein